VCPIKIDIPKMFLHLRNQTAESPDPNLRSAPIVERTMAKMYARLMSSPRLLGLSRRFGRALQLAEGMIPFSPLIKDGKWIRMAPLPPLSKWTRSRDLPALPKQSFHDIWKKELSRDDS